MEATRFKVMNCSAYTDEVQDCGKLIGCEAIEFNGIFIRYDCIKYKGKLYIWEWWSTPVIKEVSY